jgi:hypothetical protein
MRRPLWMVTGKNNDGIGCGLLWSSSITQGMWLDGLTKSFDRIWGSGQNSSKISTNAKNQIKVLTPSSSTCIYSTGNIQPYLTDTRLIITIEWFNNLQRLMKLRTSDNAVTNTDIEEHPMRYKMTMNSANGKQSQPTWGWHRDGTNGFKK